MHKITITTVYASGVEESRAKRVIDLHQKYGTGNRLDDYLTSVAQWEADRAPHRKHGKPILATVEYEGSVITANRDPQAGQYGRLG